MAKSRMHKSQSFGAAIFYFFIGIGIIFIKIGIFCTKNLCMSKKYTNFAADLSKCAS